MKNPVRSWGSSAAALDATSNAATDTATVTRCFTPASFV
jgi:hypothetical protein